MLLAHTHPIPAGVSLAMVAGILAVGILASVLANALSDAREHES